jgi:L,D-transpeptidase YcbB
MNLRHRHWLDGMKSAGAAAAALLISGAALAGDGPGLGPAPRALVAEEPSPQFGELASIPLLDAIQRREEPAPEGDSFARLVAEDAVAREAAASGGAEPSPPTTAEAPTPTRTASPVPPALPTAVAEALDSLIAHDGPVNPLGDGDWRAARAAIGAFYAERGFQPIWVDANGLTPAGRAATAQLERAAEDGLNLSGLALPTGLGSDLSPAEQARAETAIAAAVVVYAEQASGSRVLPGRVSRLVSADASVADPGAALADVASAPDPGARLLAFNPPQKGYRDLREQLRRFAETPPAGSRRPIKAALESGEGEASLLDDPGINGETGATKRRHTRAWSASADSALAFGPVARQRAAILANMEMWRWEPRDMGERRIEVNVPDYSVAVLDGDTVIHRARVVVGKPNTPTPIFSNVMRYVLINPSWLVPDSIIKKEILPRLGHFTSLGYEVKTVGGRITVRQPPGDGNALGRLAFMFPNDYSVYLHDTPARRLFNEDMRALSHGCVRVEEPERLAELVLGWPSERVDAAIGGRERTVFLPKPIPIHIEYFTEFVDEFGDLQERPDIYGLAQRVAGTLSAEGQD